MRTFMAAIVALAVAASLAGCASLRGPSRASRALSASLEGKDVGQETRQRIVQDEPLTLEDIKALARVGVPDDLVIDYLGAIMAVYRLGSAQIVDLHTAGVSERLIDYLLHTPFAYPVPAPLPDCGCWWAVPGPYPYYWYPYPCWRPRHRRWH